MRDNARARPLEILIYSQWANFSEFSLKSALFPLIFNIATLSQLELAYAERRYPYARRRCAEKVL